MANLRVTMGEVAIRQMKKPLDLSIIIISWNTADMLYDCLASVFSRLGRLKAEIIVVDNGSSDGSAAMVQQRFPQAILLANSENCGFAAANNQALKVAQGEFSLLLNSDTVVHGDVLERSLEYMIDHPQVGVLGCRVLNTDGSLQLTCSQFPTLPNLILLTSGLWKFTWPPFLCRYQMNGWDRRDERNVEVVSGCFMFVRMAAFRQVGLLDENFFFYGEETDWCQRFQKSGWALRFAPVGEITHHGSGSVRKLSYRRDLLLSNALVRLHVKHGGLLPGLTAWLIIFVFHLSRGLFWTTASIFSRKQTVQDRRNHFLLLLRRQFAIWPSQKPQAF